MKNIRLGVKLVGGFLIAALITLGVGVHDYLGIEGMIVDIENLNQRSIPGTSYTKSVEGVIHQLRGNVFLMLGQEASRENRSANNAHILDLLQNVNSLMTEFSKLSPASQKLTEDFTTVFDPWAAVVKQIVVISEEVVAADGLHPDRMIGILHDLETQREKAMRRAGEFAFLGSSSLELDEEATEMFLQEMDAKTAQSQAAGRDLMEKDKALRAAVDAVQQAALVGDLDRARILYRSVESADRAWQQAFAPLHDKNTEMRQKFQQMYDLATGEGAEAREPMLKQLDTMVTAVANAAVSYATGIEQTAGAVERRTMIIAACAVVLCVIIGIFLTRSITAPLHKGVVLAQAMAGGDLTRELDINQQDEVGQLANALNEMVVNLRGMMNNISKEVQTVTSSADSLAGISAQVTEGATNTTELARQVAAAAEEMSSNQTSVAAAMEEATVNVNTVATATEEMSATIGEIAANSGKAREITSQAVRQAKTSSDRIHELGDAANEINKVTEAITAISSQTNLLALNATIEAARAGEAGRGFAVVANEIKELAQQTARSTEEIQSRIQDIQQATQLAVGEINQISGIVGEVDDIVSTIAAAVEEQSVTTRDIAGNVGQASLGLTEVNTNVNQSSIAANQIASEVANVTVRANEMLVSSEQVKMNATELAGIAETLEGLVRQFKLT